jgi:hypothetical protein
MDYYETIIEKGLENAERSRKEKIEDGDNVRPPKEREVDNSGQGAPGIPSHLW